MLLSDPSDQVDLYVELMVPHILEHLATPLESVHRVCENRYRVYVCRWCSTVCTQRANGIGPSQRQRRFEEESL